MAAEADQEQILYQYKYFNVPLEKTMLNFAKASGYNGYKENLSGEYAQLLCNYKWNRMTKLQLLTELREDKLFKVNHNYSLGFG